MMVEEEADVEAAAEEIGSSGIDDGGGDRWSTERQSRERWGLRECWDESEMTRSGLLFIGSKISVAVLK
jgi:hypothetical protein